MAHSQSSRLAARHLLLSLVVVCVVALTGSLVTRTFHLDVSYDSTARSNSPHPVHQHLDRDATQWLAPVKHIFGIQASANIVSVALPVADISDLMSVENLYNRPPPSL